MTYEPVSLESLLVHQGWARRMARRLVREESDADDLVQRTWLAALRRPPDQESGARAWIRKVILNLARERHRRDQARVRHEFACAPVERSDTDAAETVSHKEVLRLLGEQLLTLNEPYRSVLVQRYYDGLTSAEISRRLGVPAGTVRWRLKTGLDQLRAELDRRSNGDRSRWVSALLLFTAPESGLPSGEDATRPRAAEGASRTGLAAPAGWIVLATAGAAGIYTLTASTGGRGADTSAATHLERLDVVPRTEASASDARTAGERTPLPTFALANPGQLSAGDSLPILVVTEQGDPVPSAKLLVAKASGFEERGQTDAEGRTRVAVEENDVGALGIPATEGRVGVRALAPGRVASELVHVAWPFERADPVRLEVGGPELPVSGRVLDASGDPVPGAVVAWFEPLAKLHEVLEGDFASPSFLVVTADETGAFTLSNVGPRGGMLGFGQGYAATWCRSTPGTSVEFRLDRGATISGRVRLPGGRPAVGVTVAAEPQYRASEWAIGLPDYEWYRRGFCERTRTDADGRFRIEGVGVSPGQRTLWALADDGKVASIDLALVNGGEVTWEPELVDQPDLRLRFVDESGQPLAGWQMQARQRVLGSPRWVRRCTTDDQGRIVIPDCPAEDVVVDLFQPLGVGTSYVSQRVSPSDVEMLVEVVTRDTSVVSGRITDSKGVPELDGKLFFHSVRSSMNTVVSREANGEFEQRLAPGLYLLELEIEPAVVVLAKFRLGAGENRELGVLAAPALGALRVDATRIPDAGGLLGFELLSFLDEGSDMPLFQVHRGPLEDELVLPAFEGKYVVVIRDQEGSAPRRYPVQVVGFGETLLEISP